MRYRKIGKYGLKVSEIAIGSWMTNLSSSESQKLAEETIDLAISQGVNFIDCADAYSGRAAEQFLGEILKKYNRNELVLSSKVYFPTSPDANGRGLSRKHIFESIQKSLDNMKTDYLDMYFCHRFDVETPLEETMQALSDLVNQGKILYIGVSEWTPVQILEALLICKEKNLHPISVIQPQNNIFDRYIEHEMLDLCELHGIGIVPFSPLSQGLLTGKYRKNLDIPIGSRATYQDQIQAMLTEDNLDKVEKLIELADSLGTDLASFSLAWALRKQCISSLITGATKPEQLKNNLNALVVITDQVEEAIDHIFELKKFNRKIG